MRKLAFACLAALMLSACSSNPPASSSSGAQSSSKSAVQPAEYETGRAAFQRMYLSARGWAGDATPFRLQSQFTPDAPAGEGKAGVWRASFASPSKRMMKMFMWSGITGTDAPERGVSFSAEDTWSANNTSTHPFDVGFVKIDSDKAYEIAQKNGGDKLTKKDSKQPIFFVLDWDTPKNQLVWHVVYGSSQDDAKLRIAVNASTGEFLRIEK
jgi:hypothetical protein